MAKRIPGRKIANLIIKSAKQNPNMRVTILNKALIKAAIENLEGRK